MNWLLYRMSKMTVGELITRGHKLIFNYFNSLKFRDPGKCPYSKIGEGFRLNFLSLPKTFSNHELGKFKIFNRAIDLYSPIDWFDSIDGNRWSNSISSKIKYRPGNNVGDIRFNWELNRLQFLPLLALTNEDRAIFLISDWLDKNYYLNGPSYLSSMEVALRWISIYRAVCLLEKPAPESLTNNLAGLAVASGDFIEKRLSTHSSAGNHLIIEAIGLFWIGKSLENEKKGLRWITVAREILWREILRQLNSDGTNKEQTFWYLGFVIDGLLNYMLLEDLEIIPDKVLGRIEKSFEFINRMVLCDGSFPDYGDRDDGFVFRTSDNYEEPYFAGLLNVGAIFFNRPEWIREIPFAMKRREFFISKSLNTKCTINQPTFNKNLASKKSNPSIFTYPNGGMTLIRRDEARVIFRHNSLGLEPTFGHGHADALSVLIYWGNTPVLIDLGAGQYNGDQNIRNYFRSTIAHNTVEIGGSNQADILGPFLWDKSYETFLAKVEETLKPMVQAYHTGYKKKYGIIHNRKIEWPIADRIIITDSYSGVSRIRARGAFHLGPCNKVGQQKNNVESFFNSFRVIFSFPKSFNVDVFCGSLKPFMGWRSTVYGNWKAIYSIIFSFEIDVNDKHEIGLQILEN